MEIKFQVKKHVYVVGGDKRNYWLDEIKNPKKGLAGSKRYYQSLPELLKDVFHMSLRRADNVDSFRALATEAKELNIILNQIKEDINLMLIHPKTKEK